MRYGPLPEAKRWDGRYSAVDVSRGASVLGRENGPCPLCEPSKKSRGVATGIQPKTAEKRTEAEYLDVGQPLLEVDMRGDMCGHYWTEYIMSSEETIVVDAGGSFICRR